VELYFEKIENHRADSFRVAEFRGEAFICPFHYHPEIEVTLIESGSGRRFVGDHIGRFDPGDLVVIGSGLPHMYYSDAKPASGGDDWARSIVIQFSADMWGDAFWSAPEIGGVKRFLALSERGIRYNGETVERVSVVMRELGVATGVVRMEKLIRLLALLSASEDQEFLSSEGYAPPRSSSTERRIHKVYALINERFRERLTQEEVAKQFNMSPSSFSRFFRESSGKTFSRFLNEVRIGQACQRLQVSEDRILEVCYDCGFSNLSNFNRRFLEQVGMTPKAYRKLLPINAKNRDLSSFGFE